MLHPVYIAVLALIKVYDCNAAKQETLTEPGEKPKY